MSRISFGLTGKGVKPKYAFVIVRINTNIWYIPLNLKYLLQTLYFIIKPINLFVSGLATGITSKLYSWDKITVRQLDYLIDPRAIYNRVLAVNTQSLLYLVDSSTIQQVGYIISP